MSEIERKKLRLERRTEEDNKCYLFRADGDWHHCHHSPTGTWNCGPLTTGRLEHHFIMMEYTGVVYDLPADVESAMKEYLEESDD